MSRDPYEGVRHALTLIPLIQAHQGLTVDELSARTGLSNEAITEELAGLVMMCGVPPYAPNNYVSFWVEDGRVYVRFADQFERPVRLILQEAIALSMALRPLESRDHPYRNAVQGLRKKLHGAIGPETSKELGRAERTFQLPSYRGGGRIGQLKDAMAQCRELRITYWSAHRAALSERVIQPYGMQEHQGDWYVIANDSQRKKPVSFRVDRIREAELLDTEYEVPLDFDVGQWTRDRDFVAKPQGTRALVRFRGDAARFVREDLPAGDCKEQDDGSLLATVRVSSEVWFLSWLFRYGAGAEVLEPPELRQTVRETCERVLAFYDEPQPDTAQG